MMESILRWAVTFALFVISQALYLPKPAFRGFLDDGCFKLHVNNNGIIGAYCRDPICGRVYWSVLDLNWFLWNDFGNLTFNDGYGPKAFNDTCHNLVSIGSRIRASCVSSDVLPLRLVTEVDMNEYINNYYGYLGFNPDGLTRFSLASTHDWPCMEDEWLPQSFPTDANLTTNVAYGGWLVEELPEMLFPPTNFWNMRSARYHTAEDPLPVLFPIAAGEMSSQSTHKPPIEVVELHWPPRYRYPIASAILGIREAEEMCEHFYCYIPEYMLELDRLFLYIMWEPFQTMFDMMYVVLRLTWNILATVTGWVLGTERNDGQYEMATGITSAKCAIEDAPLSNKLAHWWNDPVSDNIEEEYVEQKPLRFAAAEM